MRDTFSGQSGTVYHIRPAEESERDVIAAMIEGDEDHRCQVSPETFYKKEVGRECKALTDSEGRVLFYFRLTRVLRMDIQFDCSRAEENQQALQDGFRWLQKQAMGAGFREIIFDSVSRPLINFCKRRFGFRQSPNELVCTFAMPKAASAAQHPVQTSANEGQ